MAGAKNIQGLYGLAVVFSFACGMDHNNLEVSQGKPW
jgi:hypothetical protein